MAGNFSIRKLAVIFSMLPFWVPGSANADSNGSFQLRNAFFRLTAASAFCDAVLPFHSQGEAAFRTGVFDQWKLQLSSDLLEDNVSVDQIGSLLRYLDGVFYAGARKYDATVCAAYAYTELGEDYWNVDIGKTIDLSQNPQWAEDIQNHEKLSVARDVEMKVCEVASSFWVWRCPDINY